MNVIFYVFFPLWLKVNKYDSIYILHLTHKEVLMSRSRSRMGWWNSRRQWSSRGIHCSCCWHCPCRPPGRCSSPPSWWHWWNSKTQCPSSSAWRSACSPPAYPSIYNTETSSHKTVQPEQNEVHCSENASRWLISFHWQLYFTAAINPVKYPE